MTQRAEWYHGAVVPSRSRPLRLLALSLVLASACIDGPKGPPSGFVELGGHCFFTREWVCDEGLWCGYDRCRHPCVEDSDCPPPGACVPDLNRDDTSDQPYDPVIRVCVLPDEAPCDDDDPSHACPEGLYCVEGVCREGCTEAFPCRDGFDCRDQVCTPIAKAGAPAGAEGEGGEEGG